MSTNRFTDYKPNDYVSTRVPLPVEFMAQTLASKQGQYDNALAQADAAEEAFKINAIDQHQQFKQQKQKEYNDKLAEISDYIVKTGDTSRAREIKSLANRWKNDPDVNEMQTSKAQWDLDQAAILKATNDRVYHERNNPFLGFTGVNPDGTIQGYRAKGVRPTKDYTAGADLAIDNIKANLDATGEYVDNNKVINTAMQVAPTFLMSENNQDFIDEAFGRQMPSYSQLTPELQAQLVPLAANYLAKRAAPQIFQKDVVVKEGSGGSGNGSGDNSNLIMSDYGNALNGILLNGKSSAPVSLVAAINNGVVDKDNPNSYIKNVSQAAPIFRLDKNGSIEDNKKINTYIEYRTQADAIKNEVVAKLSKNTGGSSGLGTGYEENGRWYYNSTNDKGEKVVKSRNLEGSKNKDIRTEGTLNDFIKRDLRYSSLEKQAEALGIKLKDAELDKQIKNYTTSDLELIKGFNSRISQLQGNQSFTPDAQNSLTTDSSGAIVSNDNLDMSEAQANAIFSTPGAIYGKNSQVDKLVKLGLITPYSVINKDGEEETRYNIPVHNQTDNNIDNIMKSSEAGRWGSDKFVKDDIQLEVQQAKAIHNKIKVKQEKNNYLKLLKEIDEQGKNGEIGVTSNTLPSLIDNDIDNALSNGLISRENIDAYKQLKKQYLSIKDKDKKYNELYMLHLALTNPNEYKAQKGLIGSDVGKQTEDWKKTPSNPLK